MQVTDKMVEAGAKACREITFNALTMDECRDAVRAALTAALAHREAEAGTVKALEWVEHPNAFPAPAWSAQTGFGFYNIEEISASDSPAYEVRLHAHHLISVKDDLEAAKAAAQADYERRVRSALVAPPAQEPVAWVREGFIEELHQGGSHSGIQTVLWLDERNAGKRHSKRIPLYASRPAVPEGMVLEYRLLEAGDIIQAEDEVIADDGVTWQSLVGWEIGMRYTNLFKSIRRQLTAAQEGR